MFNLISLVATTNYNLLFVIVALIEIMVNMLTFTTTGAATNDNLLVHDY